VVEKIDALKTLEEDVARNVTGNLWERHIKPLFLGQDGKG